MSNPLENQIRLRLVFPFELNSKKFLDDLWKIAKISELATQEPLSRDFALKYKRTWKKKNG